MTNRVQHLTRSQYVLTYGPGAIIESENGPRLIPSINNGFSNYLLNSSSIENFEITDNRLRVVLKNLKNEDAKVFAIPTNASLGKPQTTGISWTYVFPRWKVCYGRKSNHSAILFGNTHCPICGKDDDTSPVRFIMACTNGHMDEVRWDFAVHKNAKNQCRGDYFLWKSEGSSLSDIIIECLKCGGKTTMQDIYRIDFRPCTARLPEREVPYSRGSGAPFITEPERNRSTCDRKMKVLQRQSSALRYPETITLLTIPEYDNAISNVLQRTAVASAIEAIFATMAPDTDNDSFIRKLQGLRHVSEEAKDTIINFTNENGLKDLKMIYERLNDESMEFLDFIYEEYDSLSAGAPRSSENFSISQPIHIKDIGKGIPSLSVFPVDRLRTVTAQVSYSRIPYTEESTNGNNISEPAHVPIGLYLNGQIWYPGFEGRGEGIFITLTDGYLNLSNNPAKAWEVEEMSRTSTVFGNPYWENITKKPLFVWFHTLSHSLIRAISQYSGYSSASLRERVYIDRKFKNGGILIYTTSPGEDGSMGGLVGMLKNDFFVEIIAKSLEDVSFCSNDPLCIETQKIAGKVNGSCCYSCLFTSETSCEHRNMSLDRHIILGD